ncbi:MAG: beta-ketoacyl-[acyl-carrier-protein] synthase family protein [Planctomycetes bacterium]|nr:beta-ketoacyl-[acyl-carrier-protein] synthase family protein [Planctomycetota bacterium]
MSDLGIRRGPGDEAVVITGMAAVSPLGCDLATILDNLFAGTSGVRAIDVDPRARTAPEQFAAPVTSIPTPAGIEPAEFARLDRLEQMCLQPLVSALADARLDVETGGPRVGLVVGLGAEHLKAWELDFLAGGTGVFEDRRPPTLVHRLAARLGFAGPAVTAAAACASSGYALALARRWLDAGWVDACVAGGCDILSPTSIAAFYNLRALSRRADDPAKASRPFDRDRDGFVMGEGGAFFVLERHRDASARGARRHGELAGVGMSSDGVHMVTPSTDPAQAARAITAAFDDAGVTPDEVDYVNAHAAGTPVGDVAEAGAIRLACGAATDMIPVSSTKSMTGHLVSGAAAFEAVVCLGAMARQQVPPTVNLDQPDPACPLVHVPHVARDHRVAVAASNSFGFGGSNLCLVLRQAA